jgi:(5-formylfuran-3-yl)methyl phosphate synthase
MRLLVSVANAREASAALAGGADIIDAKDPGTGALGAVCHGVFGAIRDAVGGARPLTAALGDAGDEGAIESDARAFVAAGAWLVKVGFAGVSTARARMLLELAIRGASEGARRAHPDALLHGRPSVVAVAYADHGHAASPGADALVAMAARAGARGVLLDTFDKTGPGLRQLVTLSALTALVAAAHDETLIVAVAGRLTADDIAWAGASGADIVGVRGAACEGVRTAHISAAKVRRLSDELRTKNEE